AHRTPEPQPGAHLHQPRPSRKRRKQCLRATALVLRLGYLPGLPSEYPVGLETVARQRFVRSAFEGRAVNRDVTALAELLVADFDATVLAKVFAVLPAAVDHLAGDHG